MTRGQGTPSPVERSREVTAVHTHLLRVTLTEPDCRAYWESVDLAIPLEQRAAIAFEQAEALGELTVRWTGADDGEIEVSDEFDELDEEAPEDGESNDE